jgi:site-specific DNA-cytosine methylase
LTGYPGSFQKMGFEVFENYECDGQIEIADTIGPLKKDLIIDCFAGGGGASVGIEMALGRPVDIAINHDPQAIRMHKVNHPDTLHLTEDIFKVDLKKYVAGRHVALMWASPDCTSHSKAKGGQPRNKGLRILPWAVYKHAKAILPDVILMENVEEIQQWGPLDEAGHPIKERAGEDYKRFIAAMKKLGYDFDSRELVAADYGAPTTRKRWYAIFRRDGKPIVWPEPTHSKCGDGGRRKWLECGDYIDWSDLGRSIFDRPKPLAEATMKRIANGYVKYVVNNDNPYIVNNHDAVSFLIQYHGETREGDSRGQLLTEPIKTIDTSNRYGLVTAFVTKFYKTGIGQGCEEPLHTITTSPGHFGLISAFLIKYYGTGCGQEAGRPLGTITTKDRFGLVNVITDIDGEKYVLKDIFLRMLKPEELKRMQGFPEDYILNRDIEGKPYPVGEQVARIGNSVVPIMAQALVSANCPYLKVGERMPNMSIDDSREQLRFA